MSGLCTAQGGGGFISAMATYLDCQAQTLGSGAWLALAAPGSTLSVLLTSFLTIFIAVIGYNLLLGRGMTVREGTLAAIKIGMVFALATSWPAYRTLVYDLVVDGPIQLVAEIGPAAGVAGSDGTLLQRLDRLDLKLSQLAVLGPGNAVDVDARIAPPPFGGFDAFALGVARIVYLLVALIALGAVRLIAGLMLALGPLFIAFLLFDNTRSLFEGWVRVLGGTALAAVGGAIALGLEVAMLEPWLGSMLARRAAGEALPTVSVELFVIAALFAIVTLAALFAAARTVRAFRLAPLSRFIVGAREQGRVVGTATVATSRPASSFEPGRERASAIAQVMTSLHRRQSVDGKFEASSLSARRVAFAGSSGNGDLIRTMPVGHSFRRRASSRVTGISSRRDAGK
jgi:type IV secretion system protein VirB6